MSLRPVVVTADMAERDVGPLGPIVRAALRQIANERRTRGLDPNTQFLYKYAQKEIDGYVRSI